MSQIISGISQSKVLSQLDTYNHTALLNSMYKVVVKASEIPPSGLIVTIQQNGSTKAVSTVADNIQGRIELQVVLNCAINDVIGVILSSASASDTGPNAIKAILAINPGGN